jgi:hypothetical protein
MRADPRRPRSRSAAAYLVALESNWTDPAATSLNVGWTRDVYRELEPTRIGEVYLNFPGFRRGGRGGSSRRPTAPTTSGCGA